MKLLKTLALIPMFASTLSLSACNISAADVASIVQGVQADTALACSVIPDANSILALFANNPVVASIDSVASVLAGAICKGVAAAGPMHMSRHYDARIPGSHMRLTPPPINVNGVVVSFV